MSVISVKDVVKEKYGEAALRVNSGGSACSVKIKVLFADRNGNI